MNMENRGVILIYILMAGGCYQPLVYAPAQETPAPFVLSKEDYERYWKFFNAEGMLSFEKNDDKRYALFIDSFKRFFDRVKTSSSFDEIRDCLSKLQNLSTAYISAYAKLLIFMVSDKDCGLQSSQEWSLSEEKKRAVLLAVLHNLYNHLWKSDWYITHHDVVQAVSLGIREHAGRPPRPSEVKAKLLPSVKNEARMYTLRDEFIKIDILGHDKDIKQKDDFTQKCAKQVLAFIQIEQKYATYQAKKDDEQGRLLVEEYNAFVTKTRDPLLQMIHRFGTTLPVLTTKMTWDAQDCGAAILLLMTSIAQKKTTTLTSQWEGLHNENIRKEQQEKAYQQARSFGTDSVRASAFEQYTRLKSKSDFASLARKHPELNTQPDAVDIQNAFERYDTLMNRYFEKGVLSEADLGELNLAVSKFALERQKLAQKASSRNPFKGAKKNELQQQIAILDHLTKLSIEIRNASVKGVSVATHEQLPHAIGTVVELLDILTDLIKSDPKFVHYIKEIAAGNPGGLARLLGHIRSFKSVKNIMRLLSLWGNIEKNEILSQAVNVGQDIFKNHLDKIKQINKAFGVQQKVVSTPQDVLEWQQNLENNLAQLKGASFVDDATYRAILGSARSVSSFGSPDVGFKDSLDRIMQGYNTLLLAAWRENYALQKKLASQAPLPKAVLPPRNDVQEKAPVVVKKPQNNSYNSYDPLAGLWNNLVGDE